MFNCITNRLRFWKESKSPEKINESIAKILSWKDISDTEIDEHMKINKWHQDFVKTNQSIVMNNPSIALSEKYINLLRNIQYDREIIWDMVIHVFPSLWLKFVIPDFDNISLKHGDTLYDNHRSLTNLIHSESYKKRNDKNIISLDSKSQEDIIDNFLKLINYMWEQFNFGIDIDIKFLDHSTKLKTSASSADKSWFIVQIIKVWLSVITGQKYSMPYKLDDMSSSSLFCDLRRCPTLSNISNKIDGILCPVLSINNDC